jgi:hypothetical protein
VTFPVSLKRAISLVLWSGNQSALLGPDAICNAPRRSTGPVNIVIVTPFSRIVEGFHVSLIGFGLAVVHAGAGTDGNAHAMIVAAPKAAIHTIDLDMVASFLVFFLELVRSVGKFDKSH